MACKLVILYDAQVNNIKYIKKHVDTHPALVAGAPHNVVLAQTSAAHDVTAAARRPQLITRTPCNTHTTHH